LFLEKDVEEYGYAPLQHGFDATELGRSLPGQKKEALMDVVVKVKKEASKVCWIGWK
jgi:hypothetical protein